MREMNLLESAVLVLVLGSVAEVLSASIREYPAVFPWKFREPGKREVLF